MIYWCSAIKLKKREREEHAQWKIVWEKTESVSALLWHLSLCRKAILITNTISTNINTEKITINDKTGGLLFLNLTRKDGNSLPFTMLMEGVRAHIYLVFLPTIHPAETGLS